MFTIFVKDFRDEGEINDGIELAFGIIAYILKLEISVSEA